MGRVINKGEATGHGLVPKQVTWNHQETGCAENQRNTQGCSRHLGGTWG